MKSAVFLYNTQSGKCKIGHCTDSICTVFRAYGYEITPQPIDFEANPFDGNEQIDLMVVAGGDGTVNYVVNSMKSKGLDIPLGVIPAGTANDFAGALGMSHKPLEAARQIASGAIDRVDCGCVNGLYFVNIFSFGIFTTTSQRTPDERKHKIGKLAYIIEGVKEFRAMHAVPLPVVAGEGVHQGLIVVAHKLVDALLRHALRDGVSLLVVGQGNGQVGQVQVLTGGKNVIDVKQ